MLRGFFKNSEGASAVEFAIMAPVFAMLIVGTLDIGTIINDRIKVHNIASSVAEYAAKAADDTDIDTVAQEMHGEDYAGVTLTSDFECECVDGVVQACPLTCADPDDYQRRFVSVSATQNFTPIFSYHTLYTGDVVLNSSVRRRVD